ncbi:MAG: hypothetical protein ACKVOB_10400 [Sphingomonas sp.]
MTEPNPLLVLRILSGRLSGSEHPLKIGDRLTLGHGLTHDIILRGADTAGLSIVLHAAPAAIVISVLGGEIRLLDRVLATGEEGVLPLFTPLQIGEFTAAVGERGSARWHDVPALMKYLVDGPGADGAGSAPTMLTKLRGLGAQAQRFAPLSATATLVPLALGGAALMALGAGAVWSAATSAGGNSVQAATERLENSGFKALRVSQDSVNGHLIIVGVVANEAQLSRLRQWVPQNLGRAMIDVETSDSASRAARNLLIESGIDADVHVDPTGLATVRSNLAPGEPAAAEAIALINELDTVRKVRWAPRSGAGERAAIQRYFASAIYGIATVVESDPGYIVTADGSRWFPGAVLPTGHRLVAIGDGKITLTRDGKSDILLL